MGVLRTAFGAILGGLVAGMALRLRRVAQARGETIVDVLPDAPQILQEDVAQLRRAARAAAADGKAAAARREREIEQTLTGMRSAAPSTTHARGGQ